MEVIIAVSLMCIYFIPSVAASGKRNGGLIFVLNLFLGWTVIVWIGLLIWACVAQTIEEYNLNQKALKKIANS